MTPMQVRVYDYTDDKGETFRDQCDLSDCFPDADEFLSAASELERSGRVWIGGGSAPLVLLMLV